MKSQFITSTNTLKTQIQPINDNKQHKHEHEQSYSITNDGDGRTEICLSMSKLPKTWYSVDPYQTPHDPCPRCLAESWIRKPNEDRTTDTDTIQE